MTADWLPVASRRETVEAVAALAREHSRRVLLLIGFHLSAAVLAAIGPLLFGTILDEATAGRWTGLGLALAVLCGVVAGQAVVSWLAHRVSYITGEIVFAQLRERVIGGIVALPFRTVHRAPAGDVLARTTNDIDAVSEGVRIGLPEVLVGSLTVIVTTVAAFAIDWRIALAMIVGLPILVLSTRWYIRRSQPSYDEELRSHGVFDTAVLATIAGGTSVRTLGLEAARAEAMAAGAGHVAAAENRTLRLQAVWFPLVQSAYYLPLALVVLWGGWLVIEGVSSLGSVVAIALYVQIVIDPLDDLLYWADQLQLGRSAFARIQGVAGVLRGTTPQAEAPASLDRPAPCTIELSSVCFEYEKGTPALGPVTLQVEAGTTVALVGPSGAGKSTLGLVLSGIEPPSAGVVRIAGRTADGAGGPPRVVVVTQEQHVFAGTLRYNLQLAQSDVSDSAMSDALMTAGTAEWIDDHASALDDEVDGDLSAERRQQLALARVLLAQPEVLVLDEATSAIPRQQAFGLEQRLGELLPQTTILSIVHRLDVMPSMDRILVMDGGLIVGDGRHADLLESNALYAELWNAWHDTDAAGR
ncbi:ABC transporter ATP-binding protein [Leifsonia soli]|uniref:ABC-type multidrug transport system fused ATPase/permease subunit n=1 Tax=Leifsonia soli TaxID=582665 RepID=A0A852SYF8_9MICO|nr:ABC transporter ATP-binding protein [Leifsonia soli]NYD74216.1 ABC-type multidrug transport system fused ATPase/permease subunit [Leifsonia soli]